MSDVTKPVILDETGKVIADAICKVADAVSKNAGGVIYGMIIDGTESDPASAITYTDDAIGMTPAHMDYTNQVFDYGSWEDAFFMPRPCMLKSDGTVDYYLNPNNYAKKIDGSDSDIADPTYDGNAMMEWGKNGRKIWLKITPINNGKSAKVQIANYQADSDFHDYPFHNCKGMSADHFYTPIYNGSMIDSKLRSLSGQTVSCKTTGEQEMTAAKLNNPGTDELWNIECIADRFLIIFLLYLMGKSLNTQTVFGEGAHTGGTEEINNTFATGVHDAKGLFYGTNSGTVSSGNFANCVKVFGMENFWGFQNRRTNGLITNAGNIKVKLSYGMEDGTTVEGYNTNGNGYKSVGVTPTGTSGGYINEVKFTEDGIFHKDASGSATTYFCDALYFDNTGTRFAVCGGVSNSGARAGALYCLVDAAVSNSTWRRGAALSCKPLC